METLDSARVTLPFGKINLWRQPNGGVKVRSYILVERPFENAKAGVAIDGSASMRPAYGYPSGLVGALFSNRRSGTNQVSPEAQKICSYLAEKLDVDGRTAVLYWGTGPYSESIQVVGDLTAEEARPTSSPAPARSEAVRRLSCRRSATSSIASPARRGGCTSSSATA